MSIYYKKYLKYKKKYLDLKHNTDKEDESDRENFVISICDGIDKIIDRNKYESTLEEIIIKKYKGLSTGNQFGAGSVEYFFAIKPNLVKKLKHELDQFNSMLKVNKYVSVSIYDNT